jgi:D-tyrosyl-tRNA(Tyr) deacylase
MRAVVQRVIESTVSVNKQVIGHIENGLLLYLGVGREDTAADLKYIAEKVINLRIFEDEKGKMNLSLKDINGAIMVISQFTLFGDTRRGRRPSYIEAAEPEKADHYYQQLISRLKAEGCIVAAGQFGAKMAVSYINNGPVTILIDSKKVF